MSEQEIINPIYPTFLPRLTKEFIELYNATGARRIANHQVPIEESRTHPEKYSIPYGMGPTPTVAHKTDYTVPVPAGGNIQVRVYESADNLNNSNRPVYVNFHGGGWVFGSLATDEGFCSKICNRVGCVVVDVAYRLAPENPWPAQLQDSWAAFLWVRENSTRLAIDPSNIAVGGVSAGGHLSAILAQRCFTLKIPLKLQILTVPMTDMTPFAEDWSIPSTSPYPSYLENDKTPTLPLVRLQFLLKNWLGERPPNPPPVANPAVLPPEVELSPMKATSVKGLAPALVITSDVDVIRDDGETYAKKLMADGVQVKAKRFIGVPHLFTSMDGALSEAREYIQMCVDALKDAYKK